jgi:tRNA G18 (ribose-2'-O)-methylase SpoU
MEVVDSDEGYLERLQNLQGKLKGNEKEYLEEAVGILIEVIVNMKPDVSNNTLREKTWYLVKKITDMEKDRSSPHYEHIERLLKQALLKSSFWTKKQYSVLLHLKTDTVTDKTPKAESFDPNVMLSKIDNVLNNRTNRIIIVLERTYDVFNQKAVFRAAELLGVQNVWLIQPVETKNADKGKIIESFTEQFINVRLFTTTSECLEALRADDREIWATDLSPNAISLEEDNITIPQKVAIIFGREAEGCSKDILESAHRRVYLPIHGFTESLNLSVAVALIVQRMFYLCPTARGDLSQEQKDILRNEWTSKISSLPNPNNNQNKRSNPNPDLPSPKKTRT